MAEIALLESVSHWSLEKCKESIEEILPKLIIYLETEKILKLKVDALHILFSSFLPCLPWDYTEDLLFSKVMPKAVMIFDEILSTLNMNDLNTESTHGESKLMLLQLAHQLLTELIICLEYLSGVTGLLFQHMYSVPNSILHVLESSYIHCKDSGAVYGEMLEVLSDPLGSFFKEACNLQMVFSVVLEKMDICYKNVNDVTLLTDICHGVSHLCQIVSLLDVKITAALWKTYLKIIAQHHSILLDKLEISETLHYICGELKGTILQLYSLVQSDRKQDLNQKDFTRVVKICSFNLKLIVTLCGKFQFHLGDCVQHLVEIMLVLFRLSFATLHSEPFNQQQSKEIRCSIVIGIEPLVIHLLPDEQFIHCVIRSENSGFSPELEFSSCFLKIMILQKLPTVDDNIQDKWNAEQNPSLVSSLISSVDKCYVEIYQPAYLPVVLCSGKEQRMVSFYEYLCYHLFTYVASLPACHFENLEKHIFGSLTGQQGISVQLSCDVLCFLARFGNGSLCFSYCCLVIHVIKTHPSSDICAPLKALLCRLVKFLDPVHKMAFLKKFPPYANLSLWNILPISAFIDHADMIVEMMTDIATSVEKKLLYLDSLKSFYILCDEISLLSHLMMLKINPALSNTALDLLQKMWTKLPLSLSFNTAFAYYVKDLLHLALQLVNYLDGAQLLQIVHFSQEMWKMGDDLIKIAVFNFIKQWSCKKLSSAKQQEIIFKLQELLGSSVDDNTLVLQQHALRIFAKFAHMTPHEEIVAECCRNKDNLKETIKSFLCKIPVSGHLKTREIISLLNNQKLLHSSTNTVHSTNVNSSHSNKFAPPPLKKLCIEDFHNEVQSIIKQIENNIQQLENLWDQHHHSEEVSSELHALSTRILKLI